MFYWIDQVICKWKKCTERTFCWKI